MSKIIDAVLDYDNLSDESKEEILYLLVDAILEGEKSEFFNGDTWCFSLSKEYIRLKMKGDEDWHSESTKNGILNAVNGFDEIECATTFGGDYDNVVELLIDYAGIFRG